MQSESELDDVSELLLRLRPGGELLSLAKEKAPMRVATVPATLYRCYFRYPGLHNGMNKLLSY